MLLEQDGTSLEEEGALEEVMLETGALIWRLCTSNRVELEAISTFLSFDKHHMHA